jgi:tryptophan synthase alpha chain
MSVVTVADVFARARGEDRAAVIGYLPGGFPDRQASVDLVRAMVAAGVDVVEVGIPYSDPVMDGPVICRAADVALAAGITTQDVLDVVAAVSGQGTAIMIMAYWNLIEQYGPARFAAELAGRGGAGVITPDLTVEEAGEWIPACDERGLAHVFLAAPSTSDDRLAVIANASTGFVYAASLMGVTGVRSAVSGEAEKLVTRLRAVTDRPVAVGLGVSTGEQAHEVAGYADGVIVGSAYVRRVLAADSPAAAVAGVTALTEELVAASIRRNGA